LDPLKDRIFTINVGFQNLYMKGLDWMYVGIPDFDKLYYNITVHELLFGFPDPVMKQAHAFLPFIPDGFPGVNSNDTFPDPESDVDTLYTGEAPFEERLRIYKSWQGNDYFRSLFVPGLPEMVLEKGFDGENYDTDVWGESSKNFVRGTPGTQFRRGLKKGEMVAALVTQMWRIVPLTNLNDTQTFKGIDLLRFTTPRFGFDNMTTLQYNTGYYMVNTGLDNLTIARGFHLYVSKPHFLWCEAPITTDVDGISPPDPAIHDTFIDAEPNTGIVMHAAKRLQMNVHVFPNYYWGWFPKLRDVYVPLFWAEEGGQLTDHNASEFRGSVYFAQQLSYYLKWIGYFVGTGTVIIAVLMVFLDPTDKKSDEYYYPTAQYQVMQPVTGDM